LLAVWRIDLPGSEDTPVSPENLFPDACLPVGRVVPSSKTPQDIIAPMLGESGTGGFAVVRQSLLQCSEKTLSQNASRS